MKFFALASLTTLVAPVLSVPTGNTVERDLNIGLNAEVDLLGIDAEAHVSLNLGSGIGLGLDLELEICLDLELGVEVELDLGAGKAAEVEVEVYVDPVCDYTPGSGVDYPKDIMEHPDNYSEPLGGWNNIMCPLGEGKGKENYTHGYTSTYAIIATGDQVVSADPEVSTSKDSVGLFYFAINSEIDAICWKVVLWNVFGEFKTPGYTSTFISEGAIGELGTSRIALPNPIGDSKRRISKGCMTGPFKTGSMENGMDTGDGFTLAQIEANPAGFYAETCGVVRGQFQ